MGDFLKERVEYSVGQMVLGLIILAVLIVLVTFAAYREGHNHGSST